MRTSINSLRKCKYLILDDPFNGLDQQSIKKITTLISKKAENKGIVLLSSHQNIEINKHKTINLK